MGYYTKYRIEIQDDPDNTILQQFRDEMYGGGCFDVNGRSYDTMKWYDHQEELEMFSRDYPDNTFVLYGEGEESGDIWKLTVKNGESKRTKVKMVFEDTGEEYKGIYG